MTQETSKRDVITNKTVKKSSEEIKNDGLRKLNLYTFNEHKIT